ncbi:hypothetical protein F4677DRAFT_449427 [Hypoxylon crocopeplum]|nr:hypothetical protein F4677DRAFT_449427 [Hypoxylon crocopeplum]
MASTTVDGRELVSEQGEGQGWTRVGRRGRRPSQARKYPLYPSPSHSNSSVSGSTPRPSFLSTSDIDREHQRITDQWRGSACCRQLGGIVASRTGHHAISQAICLGLGSFDPEDGSWEGRRRAHVQLAAFLCMVEQLQRSSSNKICCLFQDPVFNSVDKSFIRNLGHEVVESPEGFDRVSPSTLVFGVHLYRDVYAQTVAKHLPAVFVGTPLDVWEEFHSSANPDWNRLKELDKLCEKDKFPEDMAHNTFSTTALHWRRMEKRDCPTDSGPQSLLKQPPSRVISPTCDRL